MSVSGRLGLLAVALGVAGLPALTVPALASPAASPAATAAATAGLSGVMVHGRLLVVPAERPGGHPAYGVSLADGDIVPVRGALGAGARTGDLFDGRLALPASVVAALAARTTVADPSAEALRIVDRRGLTLRVTGTPSLTRVSRAVTPTDHQQFVAALDNKGALGQTDGELLAHVSTVGTYWQREADGAISSIGVPATVSHYDTALSTSDCGLGSDFFNVVQEAEQQFPGIDILGSDQLVLFVPQSCSSGGVVGEGTVGRSFASGGALVVKAGNAIEGTYAHETGHNYGFDHANVRWSGTSMEYYGIYDVMGFAIQRVNQLTALSTPFRVFQKITQPGEIQDVDLGDRTRPVRATATIQPRGDDTGVRSVRVVDPGTGHALYLDYRSGTGQDAGSAYVAKYTLSSSLGIVRYAPGVVITAARAGGGVDDLALDQNGDTSLQAGDTWRNAARTLAVHVVSLGAAGARVTVSYTLATLATAKPTISGKPQVGRTLTARHGAWTQGTTFAYAWYADGRVIQHRTGATLRLTPAQQGKRISVRVTGTRPGYTHASRLSARTTKVTAARPA